MYKFTLRSPKIHFQYITKNRICEINRLCSPVKRVLKARNLWTSW